MCIGCDLIKQEIAKGPSTISMILAFIIAWSTMIFSMVILFSRKISKKCFDAGAKLLHKITKRIRK